MNKTNLKIGIISDNFLPEIGGGQIHVKNLAQFLNADGYNIEIFTNTQGDDIFNGIRVVRNIKKGFRLFRFFRDFNNLYHFIKRQNIIHGHYTFYLSFLSGLICKLLKKPIVITLHGLGTLDSSVNKYFRRKIYRYFSFKFANAVIATSDEMADVARRFVKENKIFIIPNGVDTNYFKSEDIKKDGKIIVLSMRRLNPKNGVQYLIEAIPFIIKKFKNIEFLISGKERLEDYLKNRVKELDIEKFVKFIGDISNEKVRDYYKLADIITFPSSAESTSIACLEAMSMKKCIVASALEVFKMMLGNNERGILVKLFERESSDYDAPLNLPEERIKMLSDAIISLANNKKLREQLGQKAREYVINSYDWNKVIIKEIENIYFNLVNKK